MKPDRLKFELMLNLTELYEEYLDHVAVETSNTGEGQSTSLGGFIAYINSRLTALEAPETALPRATGELAAADPDGIIPPPYDEIPY